MKKKQRILLETLEEFFKASNYEAALDLYLDEWETVDYSKYYQQWYEDAIAQLAPLMKEQPDSYGYQLLSHFYEESFLPEETFVAANEAVALLPDNGYAHFRRGVANFELCNYEESIADFNQALTLDATLSLAHNELGGVYRALDEPEKAVAEYTKSLQIDPYDSNTLTNRGRCYQFELKDYEKAIADYNIALLLEPYESVITLNRGRAYLALGKYKKAKRDLTRTIKLNQADGYVKMAKKKLKKLAKLKKKG